MKKILSIFLIFCLLFTVTITTNPEKAIAGDISGIKAQGDIVLIKCEQENSCPNGYGVIAGAAVGYALSQGSTIAEISAVATGATEVIAGLGAMATATPFIAVATPFALPVITIGATVAGVYMFYQNLFNSEQIQE